MIACQNCGKLNSGETNFCRFCGTKFVAQQQIAENSYDFSQPRPYAWITDEFQARNDDQPTVQLDRPSKATQDFNPTAHTHQPVPLAYNQPQSPYVSQIAQAGNYAFDAGYHCPRCGSSYLPVFERRISTAGWIVFSCLLVFTVIFFWIGLLMKENVAICPVCRIRVS